MAASTIERILILAKTYPSPSAQYQETSCVAGINENGVMRRLFPIPFRMLSENQKFKKWQWVDIRVEKASKDHRLESYKVYVDSIECREELQSKNGWAARKPWLAKIPTFESYDELEKARKSTGISLAAIRPHKILNLEINKAKQSDWTEEEREKLVRDQMQYDLFSEDEARKQVNQLKKLPFDFYYNWQYQTSEGLKTIRHKIVDWEVGALYWTCVHLYKDDWEQKFRAKIEHDLPGKDMTFLIGNQHRFQDQWLIISMIYPPKSKPADVNQGSLFD